MAKRNKKKTLSNSTSQSVFVSEDQNSNAREPTGSLSTSASAATLIPSSPNSPQPLSQPRERGLEDLDHSDDEITPLNNTGKSTPKPLTKASTSSSSSWTPTAREPGDSTTSVWAWLTASRAISELQLEHELQEERARKTMHDQKQAELLGVPLAPEEHLSMKNKNKEDEKVLEKISKYSWDHAKMQQAFDLTGRDWVALSALTVATFGVRFWRISWPDEVVLDEVHMGRHINGYIKNEFTFDPQPPLGKLLLAGVSSIANYSGSFAFDEIGDAFPGSTPYISLRLMMALMGALCSPMAYMTLKATGQSAPAALVAATLVAFDNALTANNRLFLLDAPLMFFVAATFMSWNMFIKQSPRPFSAIWWTWLLATGLSMTGAMSTKLAGVFTVAVVGMFSSVNLWQLAREDSMNAKIWSKHVGARLFTLVLLPAILYLALFHLHFSLQLYQPDITSPQAEHELDLLSRPYRHALRRKYFATEEERYDYEDEEIWSDVVFGSVIQLQSEFDNPGTFLHSFNQWSPEGSHQQQVAGYSYPDLNTHWIVIRAAADNWEKEEIPSRIQYLKNDDILRLRHVPTRKCLHSHDLRSIGEPHNLQLCEVTGYGAAGFDGDGNDWWVVEVVDEAKQTKLPRRNKSKVKALESLIRLRHYSLGCHLVVQDKHLPDPWGEGRREVVCRKEASVNARSTWRITMNDHDNLPMDTELASYPAMTFWKKFVQIHKLMLNNPDIHARTNQPSASRPLRWPIAQSMIPAWAGYKRQLTIVANPVVWWTGTLGVLAFLAIKALFILREKRGYFETGRVGELKNYHLNDAAVYFVGWAVHYVPFVFIGRTLFMHHYFPSLYLSILLASSLFSGLAGFLPRKIRFALLVGFLAQTIHVFVRLSPLSYASAMTREHCESLRPWVNSLLPTDNRLDCSHTLPASARPVLLTVMKAKARREKAIYSKKAPMTSPSSSLTAVAENTQLPSKEQQQQQQEHEGYPPIPASAPGAPPIEFLTAESPLDALARHQKAVGNMEAHLPEALRGQVRIMRMEPKAKARMLPMHFPPANEMLPMDGVFLTPYQRPPQRWDLDLEEEEEEARAKVRKEEEEEEEEKEEEEEEEEEEHNGEEELEQDQQGSSNNSNNNNNRDSSAPVVPYSDANRMQYDNNEQQIDWLLEEYKARDRAERRVRVAVAQDQYEHVYAPFVVEEEVKKPAEHKEAEREDGGEERGGTPHNTMGLKVPGKYSDRPGFATREKMMENAAKFAKQAEAKRRREAGLFGQSAKEKHLASSAEMRKVHSRIKAWDALEARGVPLGKEEEMSISASIAEDLWAKEMARTKASILSEQSMSISMFDHGGEAYRASVVAMRAKLQEIRNGAFEKAGEEPWYKQTPKARKKEEAQKEEEPKVVEKKSEIKKDSAAYAGGYERREEDEEEEEEEYEVRGPPIHVGSPEELDKVLKQLQAEGVRAEVVRGTVTHTIEPLVPVEEYDAPSGEYAGDGSYEDSEDYVSGGYDGDDGHYDDDADDDDDDDDDSERSPPIAVKNAEELASVLDKLAAKGIRAEVVRGTATRYVEPPSTTDDVEE